MEFLLSLFTVLFVALILATALTFGFALLLWIMVAAAVLTVAIFLRQLFLRWKFVRGATPTPPDVIEGEWRDISDRL